MEGIDIYSYLDYRQFCRDYYALKKTQDSHFSFRAFGRKAQVAPAYLKHIMDGKRNLSPQMSQQFAAGMDMTSREAEYFENLVRFNQAESLEEKNHFLETLRKKRARSLKDFGLAEAAILLSHWYVVAIKELVVALNSDDSRRIQKLLRSKLPEAQIEKTIEDLKAYGWLQCEEGRWASHSSQIQFPDEVKSYVVRSFHQQMLEMAKEALSDHLDRREFRSMVFTFPKDKLPQLKDRLKHLQQDLVVYIQEESRGAPESESLELLGFSMQCFSFLEENPS